MAETPVRSGVGLPLVVSGRPVGALDLSADAPNSFHYDDRAAAVLFAAHAAVAFSAAQELVQFQRRWAAVMS